MLSLSSWITAFFVGLFLYLLISIMLTGLVYLTEIFHDLYVKYIKKGKK